MSYGNPPPGGPGYPYQPNPPQYSGGPPAPFPGQSWGPPQGPQCPRCHGPDVHKPSWTWWGGFLGPKIITHWQCRSCNFGFNPTTGQSTSGSIVIYFVVTFVVCIALAGAFFFMRR